MKSNYIGEYMKPKERFMASLRRQKVDRISVGNPTSIATLESMEKCGAYFPEAHLDPYKMAKLAATGYELFEYDTISPYFSVQQEAAALGCKVNWGDNVTMPNIRINPYEEPDDIVIPKDFLEYESVSTVLDAIRILKQEYGNQVCIVGKVMGPWTLSYHLYGIQRFLMDTIECPEKVCRFLDKLKRVTVAFANAQLAEGADVITLADHATGDLVGPHTYKDFLMNIHKEVTGIINGPIILHICGKTTDRLSYIAQAGFDAFHIDSRNDIEEAGEIARANDLLLIGNINNPTVLYGGTPEDVKEAVYNALNAGVNIISPECAIPINTPNDNLKVIVQAVREYCLK